MKSVKIPRLRMFAGPNGSGKSTIKSAVPAKLLGFYINADELEKQISTQGTIDLASYTIQTTENEIIPFRTSHPLFKKSGLDKLQGQFIFQKTKILIDAPSKKSLNSYAAAIIAEFIREKLLEKNRTFSFETVMSSNSKVHFLEKAQKQGYRTYLYYIATQDPEVNILRVRNRVELGGHSVPTKKNYRAILSIY